MPLNKHFGGHGEEVMNSMMQEYGPEKAKSVFYATENARKKHRLKRAVAKARARDARARRGQSEE